MCRESFLPCATTRHNIFQHELAFQYISWFPLPAKSVQNKSELREYSAPTFVVAATQDVFFGDGEATAIRAQEVFDDVEVMVVDAKHLPGEKIMNEIMQRVVDFFGRSGFPPLYSSFD